MFLLNMQTTPRLFYNMPASVTDTQDEGKAPVHFKLQFFLPAFSQCPASHTTLLSLSAKKNFLHPVCSDASFIL